MLIDLSVPLNEETPVYPGDPRTQIEIGGVLEKDGYQDHYLCVGTHVGTHIDAPSHMVRNGKNINEIPLEQFSGRGIYIKIDDKKFDLEKIREIKIQEGDIIFFHTGMSNEYYKSSYFENYPAIPESVANYLVEKKIKAIGVDMCSPDYSPYPIHKILLEKNILIIENLTNLSSLSGKDFKVYAFPLNIALDGSPVRLVAEIN